MHRTIGIAIARSMFYLPHGISFIGTAWTLGRVWRRDSLISLMSTIIYGSNHPIFVRPCTCFPSFEFRHRYIDSSCLLSYLCLRHKFLTLRRVPSGDSTPRPPQNLVTSTCFPQWIAWLWPSHFHVHRDSEVARSSEEYQWVDVSNSAKALEP